ncbi:MAG: hypothetical protein D6698_04470 [Gammaproteobacteria bacterium]|nr:MAG: hypothetical protein D6698_04470 [Gammaproteobacteria bacterium]
MPSNRHSCRSLALFMCLGISATTFAQDLLQSFRLAEQSYPELEARKADILAAESQLQRNRGNRYPTITLSSSLNRDRQKTLDSQSLFFRSGTDYFTSKSAAIRARQPLLRLADRYRISNSQLETENRQLQLEISTQNLRLEVAKRYFSLLSALDTLQFTQSEKDAIEAQLNLARQGFELGVNAITDTQEAQARFDLARANLIQASVDIVNRMDALSELTGQNIRTIQPMKSDDLPAIDEHTLSEWESRMLAHSLELRKSSLTLQQAQNTVKLNRSGHFPEISATATEQYNETSGGNFGNRSTLDTIVGIELALPLFQGWQISAQTREAAYNQVSAEHAHEQLKRALIQRVHENYRRLHTARRMIDALNQAVKSSETALRAARDGLNVGTRTIIDVLNAQQALFRSKNDYANSRYQFVLALLTLKHTCGVLRENDLLTINQFLDDHPITLDSTYEN